MKYIGTVVTDTTEARKDRAETLIHIEGLKKPLQIVVSWTSQRAPEALEELTAGTRIIFAAREHTLSQCTLVDEDTGAVSIVLFATGVFYDLVGDPDATVEDLYAGFGTQDLEFTGTVADIDERGTATVVMQRHGTIQPLMATFKDSAGIENGAELVFKAAERSLSWRTVLDDAGRRSIVPAVTATSVTPVLRGVTGT